MLQNTQGQMICYLGILCCRWRRNYPSPTTLLKVYLFDHVILLLGQAMKSCLCIRHFNVLMSFVGDKKRAESVLKHNATEYTGADDMLFGSTYEELMAKSLSSKKQIKGTIWFNKESRIIQEGKYRAALSKRPPILKQRKRGRGISQLLIKTYNNNTL